jgi:hypothetical protein
MKNDFNMFLGSKKKNKLPFLEGSNVSNLNTLKKKKKTKIVNTQVPKEVFMAFDIYCSLENKFRNEIFPIMLRYFLEKYKNSKIIKEREINNKRIEFIDIEKVNFEYPIEMEIEVRELRAKNQYKFMDIYTQVIIQYLNDHNITIKI